MEASSGCVGLTANIMESGSVPGRGTTMCNGLEMELS